MILLGLVQNIALLVMLSVIYALIVRRWERDTAWRRALSGFLYGGVAIIGMMTAVTLEPGIIFDGRSIVLGIAGLFGGPVVAGIAGALAAAYRLYLGGAGAVMGVSVVAASAAIGVAFHYVRTTRPGVTKALSLWLIGLAIHVVMIALMLLLPGGVRLDVMAQFAPPVLIVYPIGFLLVSRLMLDQEERAEADRSLRQSEGRLRAIIEQTEQGISVGKPDGTIVIYNDAMEHLSGYTRAEVEEHGWFELVYPTEELRAEALRIATEALEGGKPYVEMPLIRKDGERRWVSFATTPITLGDDMHNLSILTDVTEQRRAEERLRELDEIVAHSPAVAFTWGVGGGWPIEFVSRSISQFGYDADVLIRNGTPHTRLMNPDDVTRIAGEIDAYLSAGTNEFDLEYRIVTAEDHERWVTEHTWVLRENDEVRALQGVLVDITDRKVAELEIERHRAHLEELVEARTSELQDVNRMLEEANAAKSRFLANMSHELRTPMNSVIGFSGILTQELAGPLNDEQRKQAEMINRSGRQLLALIDDILDLSKVEAGSVVLHVERFDPAEVVREVENSIALAAEEKGLALEVDIDPATTEIESDQAKVRQVLLNLVGNAVKFTTDGRVTIRLEPGSNSTVDFSVSDTGPGITDADRPRIFEPFVQLEQPGTAKSKGTGLGLPICRQYAELLGGEITVESETGVGSTFTLTVPAQPILR